ncbi:MAG: metallophosphoesterase family protein [Pseudomonadota bacterium]
MRFAAVADIHGNCLALEAVLADIAAQGIADVVNLGDLVSGPLEAARTADLLTTQDFLTIRGNHDRWLVEQDPGEMGVSDAAAHAELTPEHLAWIRSLPATAVFKDEVYLCHGTPASDTTYWLETVDAEARITRSPRTTVEEAAQGIAQSLILCGHTHIPRAVRLADGRMIVNPGSVGCPAYDDDRPVFHVMEAGTPDASYAILERTNGRWGVEFRLVPYDHMAAAHMAEGRGRPEWARGLATGWLT